MVLMNEGGVALNKVLQVERYCIEEINEQRPTQLIYGCSPYSWQMN
jgi:hypothetical protein